MADLKWTPALSDTDADNAIEENGEYYLNRNVEEDNPRKMTITADCVNPDGSVPTAEIDVNMKDVEGSYDRVNTSVNVIQKSVLDNVRECVYAGEQGYSPVPISVMRYADSDEATLYFPYIESYDYVNSAYLNNKTYWYNSRLNKGYISSPFAFLRTANYDRAFPIYYDTNTLNTSLLNMNTALYGSEKYVGSYVASATIGGYSYEIVQVSRFSYNLNKKSTNELKYSESNIVLGQCVVLSFSNSGSPTGLNDIIKNVLPYITFSYAIDDTSFTSENEDMRCVLNASTSDNMLLYIFDVLRCNDSEDSYVPKYETEYELTINNPDAQIDLPAQGNLTDLFDISVTEKQTDILANTITFTVKLNSITHSIKLPISDINELDMLELKLND